MRPLAVLVFGAALASTAACAHQAPVDGTTTVAVYPSRPPAGPLPPPGPASPGSMLPGALGPPAIATARLPPASMPPDAPVANANLASAPLPPPPLGVTELQGTHPPDDVTAARRLLDRSSLQSNRIRVAWRSSTDSRRQSLAGALADLESASAMVRDDIERLDVETKRDPARLERFRQDVATLKQAMETSYAFAPEAGSGLPQPSPMASPTP